MPRFSLCLSIFLSLILVDIANAAGDVKDDRDHTNPPSAKLEKATEAKAFLKSNPHREFITEKNGETIEYTYEELPDGSVQHCYISISFRGSSSDSISGESKRCWTDKNQEIQQLKQEIDRIS